MIGRYFIEQSSFLFSIVLFFSGRGGVLLVEEMLGWEGFLRGHANFFLLSSFEFDATLAKLTMAD